MVNIEQRPLVRIFFCPNFREYYEPTLRFFRMQCGVILESKAAVWCLVSYQERRRPYLSLIQC